MTARYGVAARSAWVSLGWLMVCVLPWCQGCGDSSTGPDAASTAPNTTPEAPPLPQHPPADAPKVVTSFLEAIRGGNEDGARELLTDLARKKTAEFGMQIAPPWDEEATFEVGEVEVQENGVAHVGCVLKAGEESLNVIWALRPEQAGWRVAGLATMAHPDQEVPLMLDYEDPEGIMQQFEELEAAETTIPVAENEAGDAGSEAAATNGGAANEATTAVAPDPPADQPQPRKPRSRQAKAAPLPPARDEEQPPPREAKKPTRTKVKAAKKPTTEVE